MREHWNRMKLNAEDIAKLAVGQKTYGSPLTPWESISQRSSSVTLLALTGLIICYGTRITQALLMDASIKTA